MLAPVISKVGPNVLFLCFHSFKVLQAVPHTGFLSELLNLKLLLSPFNLFLDRTGVIPLAMGHQSLKEHMHLHDPNRNLIFRAKFITIPQDGDGFFFFGRDLGPARICLILAWGSRLFLHPVRALFLVLDSPIFCLLSEHGGVLNSLG